MKYVVAFQESELEVEVAARDDGLFDVTVDGESLVADMQPAGGDSLYSLILDHEAFDVAVVRKEEVSQVTVRARELGLRVESEQERNARLLGGPSTAPRAHTVRSQMPGIVTRILVQPGEEVERGTSLIILEAMKMENEVRAAHPGVVKRLIVDQGQTVNAGDDLVVIG